MSEATPSKTSLLAGLFQIALGFILFFVGIHFTALGFGRQNPWMMIDTRYLLVLGLPCLIGGLVVLVATLTKLGRDQDG